MKQVFHVVGLYGSGRSSLILRMARSFTEEGKICAGVDPETLDDFDEALLLHPAADVLFLEHFPCDSFKVYPGHTLILMERITMAGDASHDLAAVAAIDSEPTEADVEHQGVLVARSRR